MDTTITVKRAMGKVVDKAQSSPRRPNRSWSPGRRQEVLSSVGILFLRDGFAGVSLEKVVSTTGGSLRDLYREFGDKDALFKETLERLCDEVLVPLGRLDLTDAEEGGLEQTLTKVGRAYLHSVLSEPVLALHRLVITESVRLPQRAHQFFRLGPEAAYTAIAQILVKLAGTYQLALSDPNVAARLFADMLTGDLQLRALTGLPVSLTEMDDRVRSAVALFLTGCVVRV